MSIKRIFLSICLFLVTVPTSVDAGEIGVHKSVRLLRLEKIRNLPDVSVYNDVMNYSKHIPFGDQHGRSTNVHETVHGINSYVRNDLHKSKVNAFYAGSGYVVIIENPKIKLRQVRNYIPNCVRGYRYNLYFEKQIQDWDDVPTYPIDEWSAYIAGAECAVDDSNTDSSMTEKSDAVSGSLEFSIYCTCLALCIKNLDADYWRSTHIKPTIKYFLVKSEKVFFQGKDKFPSIKQDQLLDSLRNHTDAKELRSFLVQEFDGIFIK